MRLTHLVLFSALLSTPVLAFAQMDHPAIAAAGSPFAQKSFAELKTLAGTWQGKVSTSPVDKEAEGKSVQVTLRVTSTGNALLHEMKGDAPDDPITMLYLDGDRLLLTHYCDAGNRPRMVAKASPDDRTVQFDFLDLSGGNQYGHMHQAAFNLIDANHHSEDWTYMAPNGKPVHAHMDLQRTK